MYFETNILLMILWYVRFDSVSLGYANTHVPFDVTECLPEVELIEVYDQYLYVNSNLRFPSASLPLLLELNSY